MTRVLEIAIASPDSGARILHGESVTFSGSALERGAALPGEALTWFSSLDGPLGTGGDLTRSDLSEGHHTITLAADGAEEDDSSSIVLVVAPRWVGISTSEIATCAWTLAGGGYCWGSPYGPAPQNIERPGTPVAVDRNVQWRGMSVGWDPGFIFGPYACGLSEENRLYCWGGGEPANGEVGLPDSAEIRAPGGGGWTQVAAGYTEYCGITEDGKAFCWSEESIVEGTNQVTEVAGAHQWSSLSMSTGHSCGVTVNGDGYCWGPGHNGQLGNGGTDGVPDPVPVSGDHQWTAITAYNDRSCGIALGGSAYCWGDGITTPVAVPGDYVWKSIGRGLIGITTEGDAYVLGPGTPPQSIGEGYTWVEVVHANEHTCGITDQEVALCWGVGKRGQLGLGFQTASASPAIVEDP